MSPVEVIAFIAALAVAPLAALLWLQRREVLALRAAATQRQRELEHAMRRAVAGNLSAAIVHEINQPLAAILGNADAAELLLRRPQAPLDDVRQAVAQIRADEQRAQAIIHRLRALLERHETQLQALDLHATIAEAHRLLATEALRRQVQPVIVPNARCAAIQGDPVQLQQVVINLMLNAMEAMRHTPVPERTVVIATRDVDGCVEVTVSDRGCGFGGRDAQALFQSFVTTKAGGLGLGLSISRSIVQAHGGTLAAASRPGGGAVFTLRLPALAPRPAAAGAAEASRPLSHSTALA